MALTSAELEKSYFSWLQDKYTLSDLSRDVVKIETPFLDAGFDDIVLYAQSLKSGAIVLTDDGWTLDNLEAMGLTFSRRATTRRRLLEEIAFSFGVEINFDTLELSVQTTLAGFPDAKHRLLLAIMRVNDLALTTPANTKTSFVNEVQTLLDKNRILYTPSILIPSAQNLAIHFDFSIPGPAGDQKLLRTIASPSNLNNMKIATYDINLASRTRKAIYLVILNDMQKALTNPAVLHAMAEDSEYPFEVHTYQEIKNDPSIIMNAS